MLGSIDFSSSAVTSRLLQNVYTRPNASISAGTVIMDQTFPVDPSSPFFYLFTLGKASNDQWQTRWEFTNGGSQVSVYQMNWGTLTDSSIYPDIFIDTTPGGFYVSAFDPVITEIITTSQGVTPVLVNGFCLCWSSKCDQVRVTTTCKITSNTTAYTIWNGVLQQPWAL